MGEPNSLLFSFQQIAVSQEDTATINCLLGQLSTSAKPLSYQKIREICSKPNTFILIGRDKNEKIAGMATLIIYETLLRKIGRIEDVIVDVEHRGTGLGLSMLEYLIKFAKAHSISFIELTSSPGREAANKLYQRLGFKKRDTNCYRLDL